jgi:lipoprotein-anchoring transpeptidase ErfK/SrfK
MSKSSVPARRSPLYSALIVALICTVIGAAAWTATSSPAMGLNSEVTPTHARSFAFAEIAKATYTASPTAIPTGIPTTSQIPESLVYAKIVMDASALEYAAPVAQDGNVVTAPGYGGNKYILVDISEQHMYVYEGDTLVYSFVSSTGMNNSTRIGMFSVLEKIPNAYGATWNIWMPNWLGIYWSGSLQNGIHALPILPNGATLWAGYLGVPISYGCVVLGTTEAQLLYDWADVGTPVEIQR